MSEWQIKRIKDIGKLRLGKMLTDKPKEGYHLRPYLKSKNVGWNELKLNSVEEMYFSDTELKDLRLRKNDLVISEGGEVGKTSIWQGELQECYIQNSVHKLTFNRDINPKYYLYLFYDLGHKGYFKSIVNLVSIMHLTYEKLRRLNVPVPSIEVQNSIVGYLDEKTKAIDARISVLEKKSDAYTRLKASVINRAVTRGLNPNVPLKDSGIEWIGMIPEHWEVKRMKDVCSMYGRIGFRGYKESDIVEEGNGSITLSPSNMTDKGMNYDNCKYLSWFKYYESPEIQVKDGDILFVKTGSSYGKTCYVDKLPQESTINPQLLVFKNIQINNKFFSYIFKTDNIVTQIKHGVVGSTIPTISQEKIGLFMFFVPPLSEQQSIASYLDTKCAEIDKAIDNLGKQIEALKRLKRSLINEVVTGKRKV